MKCKHPKPWTFDHAAYFFADTEQHQVVNKQNVARETSQKREYVFSLLSTESQCRTIHEFVEGETQNLPYIHITQYIHTYKHTQTQMHGITWLCFVFHISFKKHSVSFWNSLCSHAAQSSFQKDTGVFLIYFRYYY